MAGRLLEEDADKAQDDVDDEQACLVPPDAWGQGQRLHQSPADLYTDHSAVISCRMRMLQEDSKGRYNNTDSVVTNTGRAPCQAKTEASAPTVQRHIDNACKQGCT